MQCYANNLKKIKFYIALILLIYVQGCSHSPLNVDVSKIDGAIDFKRFDRDLMAGPNIDNNRLQELRKAYGVFFDVFCSRILRIPHGNDSLLISELSRFRNDSDIRKIYTEVNKVFPEQKILENDFSNFVKHYRYYFPGSEVPHFITYISAFNYGNITCDSIIGIGLDFYLGSDCAFYPSLQFPQYIIRKLNRDNILVNCMAAWYQKQWEQDLTHNSGLDYMVYEGKKMYFINAMDPRLNMATVFGYTDEQYKWAIKFEKENWGAFLENKLLFEKDYKKFIKLVTDGPSTPGFAPESAPKLGTYFGYKIVKAYMEKNKNITLHQLMQETDAQQILTLSKYKP